MTVQVLPHDRDTLDQIAHDATLTTLSRRHGFTKTPVLMPSSPLYLLDLPGREADLEGQAQPPPGRGAGVPLCRAPHAAGHSGFACGSGVFGVRAGL